MPAAVPVVPDRARQPSTGVMKPESSQPPTMNDAAGALPEIRSGGRDGHYAAGDMPERPANDPRTLSAGKRRTRSAEDQFAEVAATLSPTGWGRHRHDAEKRKGMTDIFV